MTDGDTVTATIVASAVLDAAGNSSNASSSTDNQVTFDRRTTTAITNAASLGSVDTVTGQGYSVDVTVAPVALGAGVPSGTVTVSEGIHSCLVTLSGGSGSCMLTSMTIGLKTITATYDGDDDYLGGNGTASHTVVQAETSVAITERPHPSRPTASR